MAVEQEELMAVQERRRSAGSCCDCTFTTGQAAQKKQKQQLQQQQCVLEANEEKQHEQKEEEEEGLMMMGSSDNKQQISAALEAMSSATTSDVDGDGETSSNSVCPPCNQIHVLVVDDCLIDRIIVERLLKSSLFKVSNVASGKKALEALRFNQESDDPSTMTPIDHQIDIILTDYCMPEMTGYDLLKIVKGHHLLKSIPVVFMSSEDNAERISRCLAEGAEDFIIKPLRVSDMDKLRSSVRRSSVTNISRSRKKRKLSPEVQTETESQRNAETQQERHPRFAGVVVA